MYIFVKKDEACHSEERSDEESQVLADTSASARDSSPRWVSEARNDNAIKEIDEILRKVCIIGENGKGQCESCPYREHFFGEAVEEEVVV
jgi:hypothetical protein